MPMRFPTPEEKAAMDRIAAQAKHILEEQKKQEETERAVRERARKRPTKPKPSVFVLPPSEYEALATTPPGPLGPAFKAAVPPPFLPPILARPPLPVTPERLTGPAPPMVPSHRVARPAPPMVVSHQVTRPVPSKPTLEDYIRGQMAGWANVPTIAGEAQAFLGRAISDYVPPAALSLLGPMGALAAGNVQEVMGERVRGIGEEAEEFWEGSMTPGGQAPPTLATQILMGAARSAPSMVTAAIGAAPLAAAAKTAGVGAKIARTLMRAGIDKTRALALGTTVETGVPVGMLEGVQAGLQGAAETGREVREMPLDKLRALPAWKAYYEQTDPDLSEQKRRRQATENLAARAELQVFAATTLSTGAIGIATGGGAIGKFLEGGAKTGNVLRRIARGAASEAVQEGPQSFGEQIIQNWTAQGLYDPSRKPLDNAVRAFVVGAGSGALLGGGMGTITPGVSPVDQIAQAEERLVQAETRLAEYDVTVKLGASNPRTRARLENAVDKALNDLYQVLKARDYGAAPTTAIPPEPSVPVEPVPVPAVGLTAPATPLPVAPTVTVPSQTLPSPETEEIYAEVLEMALSGDEITPAKLQGIFKIGFSEAAGLIDRLRAENVVFFGPREPITPSPVAPTTAIPPEPSVPVEPAPIPAPTVPGPTAAPIPTPTPAPTPVDILAARQPIAEQLQAATPQLTPEQVVAAATVIEAVRQNLGIPVDAIRITSGELTGVERVQKAKGQVEFLGVDFKPLPVEDFLNSFQTLITLFETADISTVLHEASHTFLRYLPEDKLKIVLNWAGGGKWTAKAQEKWGRANERYALEGIAPNENLRGIFEQFKQWLGAIYKSIRDLNVQITPELREVMEWMYGSETTAAIQPAAPQAPTEAVEIPPWKAAAPETTPVVPSVPEAGIAPTETVPTTPTVEDITPTPIVEAGIAPTEAVPVTAPAEPTDNQTRVAFTFIYRAYQSGRLNDETHRYFGRLINEDRIEEALSFAERVWRESPSDDAYTLRETANAIGKREHPLPETKPEERTSFQPRRQTEDEFIASMGKLGISEAIARENYRRGLPSPEVPTEPVTDLAVAEETAPPTPEPVSIPPNVSTEIDAYIQGIKHDPKRVYAKQFYNALLTGEAAPAVPKGLNLLVMRDIKEGIVRILRANERDITLPPTKNPPDLPSWKGQNIKDLGGPAYIVIPDKPQLTTPELNDMVGEAVPRGKERRLNDVYNSIEKPEGYTFGQFVQDLIHWQNSDFNLAMSTALREQPEIHYQTLITKEGEQYVYPKKLLNLRRHREPSQPSVLITEPTPVGLPENIVRGSTSTARAGDIRVDVQFVLVDARDIITSDDPGYNQKLQPRDVTRVAREARIEEIRSKLNPDEMGHSAYAGDGAPVLGPDGMLDTGNTRSTSVRRVYGAGEAKAEEYRTWLKENAGQFGLTAEQVDQFEQPLLVRLRTTELSPEERVQFAQAANKRTTAGMAPAEEALVDAANITPDIIALYNPSPRGEVRTNSNIPFIRKFLEKIAGTADIGQLVDRNGNLNSRGVSRVRDAVFARAYGSSPILDILAEEVESDIRVVVSAMMRAAGPLMRLAAGREQGTRYTYNPALEIVAAAEQLASLRREGGKVQEYLELGDLTGPELSNVSKGLLAIFDAFKGLPGIPKISEYFTAMVEAVELLGSPAETELAMGIERGEMPSSDELFTGAIGKVDGTYVTEGAAIREGEAGAGYPGVESPISRGEWTWWAKREAEAKQLRDEAKQAQRAVKEKPEEKGQTTLFQTAEPKSPVTREQWERSVLAAYDAGIFTPETPEVHPDVIELLRKERPQAFKPAGPTVPAEAIERMSTPRGEIEIIPPGPGAGTHAQSFYIRIFEELKGQDPKETRTEAEIIAAAREILPSIQSIIERGLRNKALDAEEQVALELHMDALSKVADEAQKKRNKAFEDNNLAELERYGRQFEDVMREFAQTLTAKDRAGTVGGRAQRARQFQLLDKYSLARLVHRAREATGRELTPEETARYERIVKAMEEAETHIKELEKTITTQGEEIANLRLQGEQNVSALREKARRAQLSMQRRQVKLDTIRKEQKSILTQLKNLGTLNVYDITGVTAEASLLITRLARTYIEEGVLIGSLRFTKVVEQVRQHLPDLTDSQIREAIRDVITGRPLPEETKERARQKRQLRRETEEGRDPLAEARNFVRRQMEEAIFSYDDLVTVIKVNFPELKDQDIYELIAGMGRISRRKGTPLTDELILLKVRRQELKTQAEMELDNQRARTLQQKIGRVTREVFNLSKAQMSSLDASAIGRQAVILTTAFPTIAVKAAKTMLRAMSSENTAKIVNFELNDVGTVDKPNTVAIRRIRAGLRLTTWGEQLSKGEELFLTRLIARPRVFKNSIIEAARRTGTAHIRISERGYVTYLNVIRSEVFDYMTNYLGSKGLDTDANLKAIAYFINVATGLAPLGKLDTFLPDLNMLFFAPRYSISRFMLPYTLVKGGDATTKKLMAYTLTKWMGFTGLFLLLSSLMGADVELDPRHYAFGQVRFGRFLFDPWGGFRVVAVLLTKFVTGKGVRDPGEEYAINRNELVARFIESKLSPSASAFVHGVWMRSPGFPTGRTFSYEPFTARGAITELTTPIAARETVEAAKSGARAVIGVGIAGAIGMGVTQLDRSSALRYERHRLQQRYIAGKTTPAQTRRLELLERFNENIYEPYQRAIRKARLAKNRTEAHELERDLEDWAKLPASEWPE